MLLTHMSRQRQNSPKIRHDQTARNIWQFRGSQSEVSFVMASLLDGVVCLYSHVPQEQARFVYPQIKSSYAEFT
jgi:hypothetical protein